MDQHQESVQVHVLVSRLLLRVCEFVYEGVGSVSPLALLCCCADQVGRGDVQEAPSSKNGELRHAYGDIRRSVCTSGISGGGLGADQLVDGVEEVTLFTKNIEKPTLISQQLLHFTSRTSSFCSRPSETNGFLGGGRYQVALKGLVLFQLRILGPRSLAENVAVQQRRLIGADKGSLWWRFRDSRP